MSHVKASTNRPIDSKIAEIESEVTSKVASVSSESVYIPSWGTFYRRDDGWHGPGGFYGPSTPMAKKCEDQSREDRDILAYYTETMQRHHDYFVFRYRERGGVLNGQDIIDYQNAMAREAAGYVNLLPEDAINYFIVEQEKPKQAKA